MVTARSLPPRGCLAHQRLPGVCVNPLREGPSWSRGQDAQINADSWAVTAEVESGGGGASSSPTSTTTRGSQAGRAAAERQASDLPGPPKGEARNARCGWHRVGPPQRPVPMTSERI